MQHYSHDMEYLTSRLSFQVIRRLINAEKFRTRSTKDEPIELRSPVTKDDIVAEVDFYLCLKVHVHPIHHINMCILESIASSSSLGSTFKPNRRSLDNYSCQYVCIKKRNKDREKKPSPIIGNKYVGKVIYDYNPQKVSSQHGETHHMWNSSSNYACKFHRALPIYYGVAN